MVNMVSTLMVDHLEIANTINSVKSICLTKESIVKLKGTLYGIMIS